MGAFMRFCRAGALCSCHFLVQKVRTLVVLPSLVPVGQAHLGLDVFIVRGSQDAKPPDLLETSLLPESPEICSFIF
jgi:hypothetical protein